jgi:DNA-binding transcriptional ArsR family regulator
MELSEGAQLVLLELRAPPLTPISARELTEYLIGFSSQAIGAYLRELRAAGLVVALDSQTLRSMERVPPGVRSVWVDKDVWDRRLGQE